MLIRHNPLIARHNFQRRNEKIINYGCLDVDGTGIKTFSFWEVELSSSTEDFFCFEVFDGAVFEITTAFAACFTIEAGLKNRKCVPISTPLPTVSNVCWVNSAAEGPYLRNKSLTSMLKKLEDG